MHEKNIRHNGQENVINFVPQLSLFGGGGAGGNGFGVGVGGGVGGGGGGSSEIIQAMQMNKSPFYASQGFGRGGAAAAMGALEAEDRCVP